MKKILCIVLSVILFMGILSCLSGCTDNFNVTRRLVVMNGRTDTIVYEMIGRFSFDFRDERIICTVESEKGVYKKIFVGLPQEAFWFVDDLSGAEVSQYRYEVNFLPEMLWPIDIVSED